MVGSMTGTGYRPSVTDLPIVVARTGSGVTRSGTAPDIAGSASSAALDRLRPAGVTNGLSPSLITG